MDLELMQKRQEFLWIVQSTYLANGIDRSPHPELRKNLVHTFSAVGLKNEMCDAVKASHLIPDDMDSVTAADDYVTWKLLAQIEPESGSPRANQPAWVTPGLEGWDKR